MPTGGEKKPTEIMTNRPAWIPKGEQETGGAKRGGCTGWLTPSGQTEHPAQTYPNSKGKQLDTGSKKGGRNEKAQEVVKNALGEEPIEEMYKMIL